jgi:LysR family glycine cleavage system transcriptional activator
VKYNLPSLKALRAVETVGRHGSITSAVNELHVTPGAISRHIALLEDYFGCKLFTRHANGLVLTEVGRQYVERLSEAFGLIDQASTQILRAGERTTFIIRALGAFSSEWLLPRIAQFENQYPEIAVSIRAKLSEVDFDTDDADVGIIVSQDTPMNVESVKLYTPYLTPIISPDVLRKGPAINSVDDLQNFRLLHAMHLIPTWDDWLARVSPDHNIDTSAGHWLERTTQITQAVKQGVGVGLAQFLLIGDDLVKGSLVAPFNKLVASPVSIYLVWPKRRKIRPEIGWFRDWLTGAIQIAEAKLERELPQMERLTPVN